MSCNLPYAWSGGQLTDYDNYFAGKPRIAWVNWMPNWINPAPSHDVIIYNEDGSVFMTFPNWKFHSPWLYLWDDPNKQAGAGNYYVAFPVEAGETYHYKIIANCADGSRPESTMETFSVSPIAAPIVPTVIMKPVKGKGK